MSSYDQWLTTDSYMEKAIALDEKYEEIRDKIIDSHKAEFLSLVQYLEKIQTKIIQATTEVDRDGEITCEGQEDYDLRQAIDSLIQVIHPQ